MNFKKLPPWALRITLKRTFSRLAIVRVLAVSDVNLLLCVLTLAGSRS